MTSLRNKNPPYLLSADSTGLTEGTQTSAKSRGVWADKTRREEISSTV